jgi:putative SOS response-associated peptidase YedK
VPEKRGKQEGSMCGRYAILEEEAILEMREIINQVNKNYAGRAGLIVSGEIAPSVVAPVLREDQGQVRLDVMKWGFPRWDKKSGVIINARCESLLEKAMFAESFLKRRIVIPASGFFEWDHSKPGKPEKYLFSIDGHVSYMAGFYSRFPAAAGEWEDCFVIITQPANELVAAMHDRMPLIMPKNYIRTWLDPRAAVSLLLNMPEPELVRRLC